MADARQAEFPPARFFGVVGRRSLGLAHDVGGMAMVLARTLRGLVPPRLDRDELWRALHSFGNASLPIVAATAAFTGMIMVLQSAVYVQRFGVYDLVGWYTGFATFREVGPVLIGLMFSGRVGASNTSELATMAVTEQLDAVRVLALDLYELLVVPRALAMILGLTALVIFGDLVAVVAGALSARWLMGVDFGQFARSLASHLSAGDVLIGVEKALAFGLVIAVVSTHFGITARGGSSGVGRAVNAQVVACAVALFVADYFLTSLIR
jgi:phospholipid/cholesterol/gamma-HCH transport system permease protein